MPRYMPLVLVALGLAPSVRARTSVTIAPPNPSVFMAAYAASGVQIYTCVMEAGVATWVLKAPDAELVDAGGAAIIHHSAGPTWLARDGSKVVGALLARAPSPDGRAVPWLLLRATATGPGILAGTRFVVRRETTGGAAPAGRCVAGETTRVPYRATYAFYR